MKALIIIAIFAASFAMEYVGRPALAWVVSNPSLYTKSFGYLPWLLIVATFLLIPRILNRLKL